MRSGVAYRVGMGLVVLGALAAVASTIFPSGTRRAVDAVTELAGAAGTTDPADLRIESQETIVDTRVRWAISVANDGPGGETGPIVVRGTLPAEAEYVSSSGRDWTCEYAEQANVLTCDLATPLASGERSELIVLADSDGSGDLGYTATVIGSSDDPDLANNVEADVWAHTLGSVAVADDAPDNTGRSTGTTEDGDGEQASTGGAGTDDAQLPVTGPGFTAALVLIGLGSCVLGMRLLSAASLPSLLEEFRQSPLWPRTEMRDHLRRGQ